MVVITIEDYPLSQVPQRMGCSHHQLIAGSQPDLLAVKTATWASHQFADHLVGQRLVPPTLLLSAGGTCPSSQ